MLIPVSVSLVGPVKTSESPGANWHCTWLLLFFALEGVSKAEIGLDKVVRRSIDKVVTSFAKEPDVGSEAIF
jgi:hypothetical protein